MLPVIAPAIHTALVAAIVRLSSTPPRETVDRFLQRIMAQGVSVDMHKLCGNVTEHLVTFAMGNQAAADASDKSLISLLQHGRALDKFNATTPVLQQCYLLEYEGLKVLLIIRPRG